MMTRAESVAERCEHCGLVGATSAWGGGYDSLTLARNPSLAQPWCDLCIVRAQVAYGRTIAAMLPGLERRLQELEALRDVETRNVSRQSEPAIQRDAEARYLEDAE